MFYKVLRRSFVVFLISGGPALAADNCSHDSDNLKCLEYVKTYDGDTYVFNVPFLHPLVATKVKISLGETKAPSTRMKNLCAKNLAKETKAFAHNILKKAKYIELKSAKRDRSFGFKGELYVDNKNLAEILKKRKLAVSEKDYKKTDWCKLS